MKKLIYIVFLFGFCSLWVQAADTSSATVTNEIVPAMQAEAPSQSTEQKKEKDAHTVAKKDTLWDIADTYYHDPWSWKIIWEANKSAIANPDVILPAQVLIIPDKASIKQAKKTLKKKADIVAPDASSEAEAPATMASEALPEEPVLITAEIPVVQEMQIEEPAAVPAPPATAEKPKKSEANALSKVKDSDEVDALEAESFVAPLDWMSDGIITGDKDKKLLISTGDTVYVKIDPFRIKPTSQCVVYRKISKVKDPKTKYFIGYEIRRIGKLEFTDKIGNTISSAKVIVSYEPLQLNDIVKIEDQDGE